MKKWKTIILCIGSIAVLFLARPIINACSWSPGAGDYPISFFNPRLQLEKGNYPFYLSEQMLNSYSDFYWDAAGVKRNNVVMPRDTNLREWQAYFGYNATLKDVDTVVYGMNYSRLAAIAKSRSIPDSMKYNKCLSILTGPAYNEAMKYLLFAKQSENIYLLPPKDSWWNPDIIDTAKVRGLLYQGKNLYQSFTDKVIKLRMGYQLVKLSGMIGDAEDCIYYNSSVASSQINSTIKNWALLWKATALADDGRKEEAYITAAKVFEKCVEKRPEAYMSFMDYNKGHLLQPEELNKIMEACNSDEDRADVMNMYALQQFYPDAKSLINVYQYEPNSPMLENLIIREVNKVESKALQHKILSSYPKYKFLNYNSEQDSYLGYYPDSLSHDAQTDINQLALVINGFIKDDVIKNKALLYLVKGYLELLQGNTSGCESTLADATLYCGGNKKMQAELHFLNLLCKINECKNLDGKTESALYPDLAWMEDTNNPIITPEYRANIYRILTQKYMAQNDYVKALVCLDKSEWEDARAGNNDGWDEGYWAFQGEAYQLINLAGNHDNLDKLYDFIYKDKQTDYDKLISSTFGFSRDRILDFEGTLYLREYNYKKAANYFSQISPSYWQQEKFKDYLNSNPFYVNIGASHSKTKADTITYNKYTFCSKMMELKKKADKNDADALFTYASGLYNMTYNGNSWLLAADSWSVGDTFDSTRREDTTTGAESIYAAPYPYCPFFYRDYATGSKAKEYYMKAFNATKDKEMQARCLFLCAKIEGCGDVMASDYINGKDTVYYSDSIFGDDKEFSYFETLRTQYNNTGFYSQITRDCLCFRDYLAYKAK